MMDFSGRQYIPYNRELFVFLPREKVSVSHRHCDVLMAHELLQLHKRDFTGLSQPGCEGMSHGMQGDGVQTITILRGQIELSDGSLEAGGRLGERCFLAGLLEDGFRRFAFIRLEHSDHVLRHPDENPLASFLNDIKAADVGIHILSAQLENFCGPESGSQGKQGHVMQLRMPLFKVVQKGLGLFPCQETQSFIVGFDHFPSTALGGQRVDSAPHAGGDSTIYGGTHERKDVVHGLFGQSFPFPRLGVGLSCGFFGLCIPGGRLQELRLEAGKQIRGQLDNGQSENYVLGTGVILTVMLVNVFPFALAPFKIGIHQVPDGDFIPLNGVDASELNFTRSFLTAAGRMPLLCLPTVFQCPLPLWSAYQKQ